MAGGVNFYNQAQAVHSKGIISALGLFLGGYLLRLRGRRIAMKRTATKKTTKKKAAPNLRPHSAIMLDGPARAPSRAMLYPTGFPFNDGAPTSTNR